jgi:hypothetical protein
VQEKSKCNNTQLKIRKTNNNIMKKTHGVVKGTRKKFLSYSLWFPSYLFQLLEVIVAVVLRVLAMLIQCVKVINVNVKKAMQTRMTFAHRVTQYDSITLKL